MFRVRYVRGFIGCIVLKREAPLPLRGQIRHFEASSAMFRRWHGSHAWGGPQGECMSVGRGVALAIMPALVVLVAPAKVLASSFGPVRERAVVGDWRLTVATDRFSGERRCRLASAAGNVVYRRGTPAIRLPRIPNSSDAVVRVDAGTPVRWRDLIPELVRRDPGVLSTRDPRWLSIPLARIEKARVVWISPGFGKRGRAYRTAGLDAALERAAAFGCGSDAAFVL